MRLPRAGWVAVGATTAAGAGALGVAHAALPVAALALLALGIAARVAGTVRGAVPLLALGAGMLAVGLRLLLVPGPPPAPPLPTDARGPWTAEVESTGSPRDGSQTARLVLDIDGQPFAVAATLPAWPEVAAGAVVEVDGRLRPPPEGGYGDYLRRTGASGALEARRLTVLEPAPTGTLQGLRDAAGDALARALPEPEAGLAAGILVGLRERVDRGLAADFTTAGVSHIVAISGWNIAIVAALVGAVLRGRPRRVVSVAVAITVVAYVFASGASPSVVRAAAMAGVVLAARESGRAGRAATALAWAAALLLVADPRMIEDAGFRLSVLATAGLVAWASPLAARIDRLTGRRLPGLVVEGLGVSLAAQAATLPDVLATFGRLSLVAPAVNLVVVPLVPIAMAAGVVALAGGVLAGLGAPDAVAMLAGLPAWLVLHLMVLGTEAGAAVPFASLTLPPEVALPAGASAAAAIGAVVLLRRRRGGRSAPRPGAAGTHATARPRAAGATPPPRRVSGRVVVPLAIVVALGGLVAVDAADRTVRLTVLDVGQGDAILLESGRGARMLVDGGPDPQRLLVELDARIPAWDRRIDIVVLTHPHEDHVAGLARVLDRYRVGRVLEVGMRGRGPGWAAWDERLRDGPTRGLLAAGARLQLGDVALSVLWPEPGRVPLAPADDGSAVNNVSIVLLGEVHGRRFLLTGDAEEDLDPALLRAGLPRLDVLKVAHHGSRTATTAALLEQVRPRVAVVSAGRRNPYGHPAPATLDRLVAVGARVLRTDRDGTVVIDLRADGVAVRSEGVRRADPAPASEPVALAAGGQPDNAFLCGIPLPLVALGNADDERATRGEGDEPDEPGEPADADPGGPDRARPGPLGYDPGDDRPDPPRGRGDPVLAPAAAVAPAPLLRGRGRRGVARPRCAGGRAPGGCPGNRGRGPAPRRRQGAAGRGSGPSPPARRGIRRVAARRWARRALRARRGPSRHPARRRRGVGTARGRAARCPDRGVRGQARRPAARVDGRAIRVVAPALPRRPARGRPSDRLGRCRRAPRPCARRGARGRGLRGRWDRLPRGPPAAMVAASRHRRRGGR